MSLPEPSPEAREHSDRVAEHIRGEISASGGWISFARYMELALYAPGLGYYSAGSRKLGKAGDFVTLRPDPRAPGEAGTGRGVRRGARGGRGQRRARRDAA